MESLMDVASGAYRVTTLSSTYEIDLDRMTVRRIPHTQQSPAALLRHDQELVTLVSIGECTVGRRMQLLLDLQVAGVDFTSRGSTEVLAIEPI